MTDLVRVSVLANDLEAEMAVSMLKAEGIHAMWRKTDVASGAWDVGPTAGIGGPTEVLVLAEDEKRARELLGTSG